MSYSYTNTPHADFPPAAVGNQRKVNVYKDHPHDVKDGIALPPMNPVSSSLFAAAQEYQRAFAQSSSRSSQAMQPLRFPKADRIFFESTHGRKDGFTIANVLKYQISSESALESATAALGGPSIKVLFKLPGSTEDHSCVVDHSQYPPVSSTIAVLMYEVTYQLDLSAKRHHSAHALQKAKWPDYRVLYLERIPGNDNVWKLVYAAPA